MTRSEALLKMDDLALSVLPIEDKISRLAILAAVEGVKPAFMGDEEEYIEEYKEAGRRLGLNVLVTKRPPTDRYPRRKPHVPPSFVKAFHEMGEYGDKKTVWLYKDTRILDRISQSVAGQINEGYALGYPECCIRAYEEDRITFLEATYNHIVDRYQAKNEQQAIRTLLTDPPVPPPKSPVLESFQKFPFISHVACYSCLRGTSEESGKLNEILREIATQVGLNDRIIQSITEFLQREKNRNRPS